MPADWHGTDRKGLARTGTLGRVRAAVFVASKFAAGWRTLTVTRDGRTVGAIEAHPGSGRRTWWAES